MNDEETRSRLPVLQTLGPAPTGQDTRVIAEYIRAALDLGYALEEIRAALPRLTTDQLYLAYRHALRMRHRD